MPRFIDITNQRFGRLVVVNLENHGRHATCRCRCDCGKEKIVRIDRLRSGETQTCGCKQRTPQAEIARFNSKWKANKSGCHIWQAAKSKAGYGAFWLHHKWRGAHQAAMILAGKEIPNGYFVNHTCRNRACVNPQHLEAIPASASWRKDASTITYVNSQKTHCPQGHPYDRRYERGRYCSICAKAKKKRLRAKWKAEGRQVNW